MSEELHRIFGRARLDDRQINELIGLAHGLTADGIINQAEAEYLQKWLVAHIDVRDNPIAANLLNRVNSMLSDAVIQQDEAHELFETLQKFSGGNFELGEVLKSTSLPLDAPPPELSFSNTQFCFTGTFAFGARKDCEAAVEKLGGRCGSLTMHTNYLVIGIYAKGSWAHSPYGRKIERAIEMKQEGVPIHIVGEQHWRASVEQSNV